MVRDVAEIRETLRGCPEGRGRVEDSGIDAGVS
jgi:hypothetical protein